MSTYQEKLLEARDKLGQQIQEGVDCDNPEHLELLIKRARDVQALLEKVVDVEGNDTQDFDIATQGIV